MCFLLSSAAHRETSDDCQSCLECSQDNGCVRCPERLFLSLQRKGMSHHGTCLHACPAGHFGQRGRDVNRCMSMSLPLVRVKFRSRASDCGAGLLNIFFKWCHLLFILRVCTPTRWNRKSGSDLLWGNKTDLCSFLRSVVKTRSSCRFCWFSKYK